MRLKLFIENFVVYGIIGLSARIIPLIMLPIITRLIPEPKFFGIFSLFSVITSFGTSLSILGTYDALFRLFFDKSDDWYRKELCSSALFTVTFASVAISMPLLVLPEFFSLIFYKAGEFKLLTVITAWNIILGATSSILVAPTRMQNKRKIFVFSNIFFPILSYAIAIPMLKSGLFLYALPISGAISSLALTIFYLILNKNWFSPKLFRVWAVRDLLKIGLPLTPTFLIYWIFSSSDRIMISRILDDTQLGIYSAAAKLAMISQLLYSAFAGGWQYFAFSTMKDSDYPDLISKVFELSGLVSLSSLFALLPIARPVYDFLFPEAYRAGFIVFPYLYLGPLLLMLFQIVSNQLLVMKKSVEITLTLLLGAVLNVLLNWLLIPVLGNEGAAIATLSGYCMSVTIAYLRVRKIGMIKPVPRFLKTALISTLFFLLWRLAFVDDIRLSLLISVVTLLIFWSIYRNELKNYLGRFAEKVPLFKCNDSMN